MSQDKTEMLNSPLNNNSIIKYETDYPCLCAINEIKGTTLFELKKALNIVGRSAENEIVLDMAGTSRKHFCISVKEDGVYIEDLNSANGTFLNNKKLDSEEKLKTGDIIKAGAIALKFLPKNSPEIITHKELIKKATIDGLTGCFNKKYFNQALEREFDNSKKFYKNLVLIIVDIDHFKNLNDTKGHDAGDAILKDLGQLLMKKAEGHKRSVLARFGGEEFVILLTESNPGAGVALAEEIRKSVEQHDFKYEEEIFKITLSLGVACFYGDPKSEQVPSELFIKADKALYQSKETGRNKVSYL